MAQQLLPLIPTGATQISDMVSVYRNDQRWTYYVGTLPVYYHDSGDSRMFKLVTAQMIEAGLCRQIDIIRTFGVSKNSVIRAVNKLRQGGIEAFFKKRQGRKGGKVLTAKVLGRAQDLLDQGYNRRQVAQELGVKYDTLRKALKDGRLTESDKNEVSVSKSSRTTADMDAAQGLGVACTRTDERTLASLGRLVGASVDFQTCLDVPKAGVLCAIPALLSNGLFEGAEQMLGKVSGYYTVFHILLLLALMALCRIKTCEQLRGQAPGEFGKLLGLDRIPEVRCLRNKMQQLSTDDHAKKWAAHLSSYWMQQEPEAVGTLYIDGHVRLYHGGLTKLPRRFVSRQRLCLRGVTDYWVNDGIGRPFFVVEKSVDPGLLQTLEYDIVPRLLDQVPNQPSDEQLASDATLSRFVMVFDREGYSPAFFKRMWKNHRIGCVSYHKHPGKDWSQQWFSDHQVSMASGEQITMKLCEMGTKVGQCKKSMWMKQVRKLTDSGHQSSVICTAFDLYPSAIAGRMFSRWSQENFFNYMMQHFEIDVVLEYGATEFPATQQVVNPGWRTLDRKRNQLQNKLRYRHARFAEMSLHPQDEADEKRYKKWVKQKSDLLDEIQNYEHELEALKSQIKATDKHISWNQLQESEKFLRLLPGRKRLMDTIRMIAYRAETAMVQLITGPTVNTSQARRLLQDLFLTEADILPDRENKQLIIRVHNSSRAAADKYLAQLFEHLNQAQIDYPGTDLRLVYQLGGVSDG